MPKKEPTDTRAQLSTSCCFCSARSTFYVANLILAKDNAKEKWSKSSGENLYSFAAQRFLAALSLTLLLSVFASLYGSCKFIFALQNVYTYILAKSTAQPFSIHLSLNKTFSFR